MIRQDLLALTPKERAEKFYRRYVLAVGDAVQAITLGVAAGACGVRSQDLHDMLEGHKGRRLPTDVGAVIAAMVSGELRDAIVLALKEMFDLVEPESDAEYIRSLEAGYAKFGEQGGVVLGEIRRKARRG